MSKIAVINFFKNNNPEHMKKNMARVYNEDGSFKEEIADYRVSSTECDVKGYGHRGISKAGNPILRINVGIKDAEGSRIYYSGSIMMSKLKPEAFAKAELETDPAIKADLLAKALLMPDYFGTAKIKDDDAEYELSGWKVTTKKDLTPIPADKQYINVTLSTPYKLEGAAPAAASNPTEEAYYDF
jgi:hypothetical protein